MTDPSSFALDETAVGSVEQIEEEPRPDYILPENALISERYQLEKCLGEGGMGVVYRARHVLMKKTVALKVLHPEFTRNDEVVARFKREAQAAANIEHPNICLATDFGQTDEGLFYLVMEHLEGETLQSTIETLGKLTPRLTIHIGKQICAALAQAHQTGVVHRDLKPENIMLVERDDDQYFVKIMDFGIARVRMDEEHDNKTPARLTKAGMVYGTPHYMSPEQVVGGDIDSRADLYALGVVLFEMVTGR
ncbi:MAG: serine/threonine protein kinase, partial [Bradymonadaceae bacterium]